MKVKIYIVICLLVIIQGTILGVNKNKEINATELVAEDNILEENIKVKDIIEPVTIKILAVGDIMTHSPQLTHHYNYETKDYNFNNNYKYVKKYFEDGDINICNVETTLSGESYEYKGYPRFDTLDELGEALINANFNIAGIANNHIIDKSEYGLFRTVNTLREQGLLTTGVNKNNEKTFTTKEIDGIRVGICAYVYESGEYYGQKTINGLIVSDAIEDNINTFDPSNLGETYEKLSKDIESMKKADIDILVFYMHWGHEYHESSATYQKEIAQFLAKNDVDIVFGSHPHVIQEYELIDRGRNGKTVVFYSMGNFISNQREEYTEDRRTEDGIIAGVEIEIYPKSKEKRIKSVKSIPTWVNMYYDKNGKFYEIIPVIEHLNKDVKYKADLEKTLRQTMKVFKIDEDAIENNAIVLFDRR